MSHGFPDLPSNPVGRCLMITKEPYCTDCGRQMHEHDKERVTYDNGTWGYNYNCPEQFLGGDDDESED